MRHCCTQQEPKEIGELSPGPMPKPARQDRRYFRAAGSTIRSSDAEVPPAAEKPRAPPAVLLGESPLRAGLVPHVSSG